MGDIVHTLRKAAHVFCLKRGQADFIIQDSPGIEKGKKEAARMLGAIAALYLLLALRIHLEAEGFVQGRTGGLTMHVGAAGVVLHMEGKLQRDQEGLLLSMTSRSSRAIRLSGPNGQQKKRMRKAWPYVRAALRAGRVEGLGIQIRLGLEDAAETALAAGALAAALSALLAGLGIRTPWALRVMPDFKDAGFAARGYGAFSFQAGDIAAAVMRTALKRAGKKK